MCYIKLSLLLIFVILQTHLNHWFVTQVLTFISYIICFQPLTIIFYRGVTKYLLNIVKKKELKFKYMISMTVTKTCKKFSGRKFLLTLKFSMNDILISIIRSICFQFDIYKIIYIILLVYCAFLILIGILLCTHLLFITWHRVSILPLLSYPHELFLTLVVYSSSIPQTVAHILHLHSIKFVLIWLSIFISRALLLRSSWICFFFACFSFWWFLPLRILVSIFLSVGRVNEYFANPINNISLALHVLISALCPNVILIINIIHLIISQFGYNRLGIFFYSADWAQEDPHFGFELACRISRTWYRNSNVLNREIQVLFGILWNQQILSPVKFHWRSLLTIIQK